MNTLLVILAKDANEAREFVLDVPKIPNLKRFFVLEESPLVREINWLTQPDQYLALNDTIESVDNPAFIAIRAALLYTKSEHIIYSTASKTPTTDALKRVINNLVDLDIKEKVEIVIDQNLVAATREHFLLHGFDEFEKHISGLTEDISTRFRIAQAVAGRPVDCDSAITAIADIVDLKNVFINREDPFNCLLYSDFCGSFPANSQIFNKKKASSAHVLVFREPTVEDIQTSLKIIPSDGAIIAYTNDLDKMMNIAQPLCKININDEAWVLIYTKGTKINEQDTRKT